MTEQPRTETAPPGERGGTHERDVAATALLGYHTHDIHKLRTHVTTIGSADADADVRIAAAYVSRRHCRIEQRTRGALLMDDGSKNGTYHERERTFGLGLKPLFEDAPVGRRGIILTSGTTFIVSNHHHHYIAIDDAVWEVYQH